MEEANRLISAIRSVVSALLCCALIITTQAGAHDPPNEEEPGDFEEDPNRLLMGWEMRMTVEEYRAALEKAGIAFCGADEDGGEDGYRWQPIGPIGETGDRKINGRISGIFITAGYRPPIYVGACSGGLWRANYVPSGARPRWVSLGDCLPNPSVRAFAVHPHDFNTIIVGTGDYARYGGSGLYITTNGGANWDYVDVNPGEPDPDHFFRIYYLPNNPDVVVAAAQLGLFRSTDGGYSWTKRLWSHTTDLVLHPDNPNIQFACSHYDGGGVFRSTDAGITWYKVFSCGSAVPNWNRASIAICREHPEHLAVMACQSEFVETGFYRSTDGGDTWLGASIAGSFGWGQFFHAQAIAIRPNNPEEIFLGGVILAYTPDGGGNWLLGSKNGIDIGHADITQLYFEPGSNDNLWICNDGGVFKHNLAARATESCNGDNITGLNCLQMDFMDAERSFRVTGMQDNGIVASTDHGETWTYHKSGDGGDVEITNNEEFEWWFCRGAFSRGCGTCPFAWPIFYKKLSSTDPTEVVPNCVDGYMPKLFYDRSSGHIYSYDEESVYSSPVEDVGTPGWGKVFDVNPFDRGKSSIYGDYADGKTIYSLYWESRTISVSRKSGEIWTTLERVLGDPETEHVHTVTASPQNTSEAWAGLYGSAGSPVILYTDDNWQTWTDITGNLAGVKTVFTILVTPFNQSQIFVGTDIGVFVTKTGGHQWSWFGWGMPVVRCSDLRYILSSTHGGTDTLVASTYGRGMWERPIDGPPVVFVDSRNNTGIEDGTLEHPYDTVDEAIAAAPVGAIIALHGDMYPVPTPPVLEKQLRFEAYESAALIGGGK